MTRTANPALRDKTFTSAPRIADTDAAMTINGTVHKTFFLLVIVLLTASWPWRTFFGAANPATVMPSIQAWLIGGAIGGLIVGIITVFKKHWSPITAPIYAALEGLVVGGLSAIMEFQFPGIVVQAVGLTFGTLAALLIVYRSGLIQVTDNFRLGVAAATGGIMLVYMATMVMGFFGVNMPFIHDSGVVGIGFSLFVVVIASMNLVMDFDFIERGAEAQAPKYLEWYAAFGLMVTLIWLYIEILRLLAKLRSRR